MSRLLSVRLPRDLDVEIPKENRSAWVLEVIRDYVRKRKLQQIIESAAANHKRDMEVLSDWECAATPLKRTSKSQRRK